MNYKLIGFSSVLQAETLVGPGSVVRGFKEIKGGRAGARDGIKAFEKLRSTNKKLTKKNTFGECFLLLFLTTK